jgi:Phage integrase, N-terminal SAM-like domain
MTDDTTLPTTIDTGHRQVSTLDRLADIPEEEIWLSKQKSARTRRAYRLDVEHFVRTLAIASSEELRQADHKAVICQRRREYASAGRSKNASRTGWAAVDAQGPRGVTANSAFQFDRSEPAFPSRPGKLVATARSAGDGRSRATRSIASMASTGPSPQRAPWQADCQSGFSTSGAGVACSV